MTTIYKSFKLKFDHKYNFRIVIYLMVFFSFDSNDYLNMVVDSYTLLQLYQLLVNSKALLYSYMYRKYKILI